MCVVCSCDLYYTSDIIFSNLVGTRSSLCVVCSCDLYYTSDTIFGNWLLRAHHTMSLEAKIADLEKQLKEKEAQLKKTNNVYVTRDKKMPKLADAEDKDEWLKEMDRYVMQRFSNELEGVDFVIDHLDTRLKSELRLRKDNGKATRKEVLEVLQSTVGEKDTVLQLQQKLFSRNQRKNESVADYCCALISLMLRIKDKKCKLVENEDMVLKERLAEGVQDVSLRRELRRVIEEIPDVPFWKFRDRADAWSSEDGSRYKKTNDFRAASDEIAASSESVGYGDMRKMFEEQQKQIKDLTEAVNKMSRSNPRFPQNPPHYGNEFQNQPQPGPSRRQPITCHYCKKVRHIQRFCRKKQYDEKNNIKGKPVGDRGWTQDQNQASQYKIDTNMDRGQPNYPEVSRVIGRCPEVIATFDGVKVNCLLDSGSEVTTVTQDFYENYLAKNRQLHNTHSWIRLTAANGLEIPCVGLAEVDVIVQGQLYPGVSVLVVKNPADRSLLEKKRRFPGVIGCNLLQLMYGRAGEMGAAACESVLNQEISAGLRGYEDKVTFCNRIEAQIN